MEYCVTARGHFLAHLTHLCVPAYIATNVWNNYPCVSVDTIARLTERGRTSPVTCDRLSSIKVGVRFHTLVHVCGIICISVDMSPVSIFTCFVLYDMDSIQLALCTLIIVNYHRARI